MCSSSLSSHPARDFVLLRNRGLLFDRLDDNFIACDLRRHFGCRSVVFEADPLAPEVALKSFIWDYEDGWLPVSLLPLC